MSMNNHRASRSAPGPLYIPSCGKCSTPPWIECECSSLLRDLCAERINAELDERLQLSLLEE
jgi:hypothetical protein